MSGSTNEMTSAELEEASTLDHALLESLFYNEMLMLSRGSPTSSASFLSHMTEATQSRYQPDNPSPAESHGMLPSVADPNAIVEKEMLQDFEVEGGPPSNPGSHLGIQAAPHHAASTHLNTVMHNNSSTLNPYPSSRVTVQNAVNHQVPPQAASTHLQVSAGPGTSSVSSMPHAVQINTTSASTVPSSGHSSFPDSQPQVKSALSIEVPKAPLAERANQLVDQFITLASRLGIEVPTPIIQSLTGTKSAATATSAPSPRAIPSLTRSSATWSSNSLAAMGEELTVAPSIEENRKAAEEAVNAVTKRRASDASNAGSYSNSMNRNDGSTDDAATSKQGKRRKKLKLEECESRLAELKSENELLKRHLQNVSNKAHRFDKEKHEAGLRIRTLLRENAGEQEMNQAVNDFNEMYSDYGENRQQELSFHLEQLQRLVNPSNFTKMGLWTMGHTSTSSKRNPIAGILEKELGITPQQGKKILDQSKKIRALCENLKECLALLATLRSLCERKTKIFHDRIDKCREILTSKQVVKLIAWIHDHSMLLETVCPGWSTEDIHL